MSSPDTIQPVQDQNNSMINLYCDPTKRHIFYTIFTGNNKPTNQ